MCCVVVASQCSLQFLAIKTEEECYPWEEKKKRLKQDLPKVYTITSYAYDRQYPVKFTLLKPFSP